MPTICDKSACNAAYAKPETLLLTRGKRISERSAATIIRADIFGLTNSKLCSRTARGMKGEVERKERRDTTGSLLLKIPPPIVTVPIPITEPITARHGEPIADGVCGSDD